jgi:hypothetical protein
MAQIPRARSVKWNIISPCVTLLMIFPNFIMVSSIWILDVGNGGNDIQIHAKGMLLGHSLLSIFMNSLTPTHTIWTA